MILKFIFFAFLLYLAYKLVFDLILPVYRTTKKVKRGFREMQERMQEQQGQRPSQSAQNEPPPKASQVGDYIDFEEVK